MWHNYRNTTVTLDMKEKIQEFLNDRLKGTHLDNKIFSYLSSAKNLNVNKEPEYKYYVALFSNVLWDANIGDKHTTFKGFLDWLISTVNYMIKRKDIKFFIKAHPAEAKLSKTSDRVIDLLKS